MDDFAILRRVGSKAWLSHHTAARHLGIELFRADGNHITVPRHRSRLELPEWHVHRADVEPDDSCDIGDLRLTAPLRTVLDLARVLPHAEAVVAADSALRQAMVSVAMLVAAASAAVGRGAKNVRSLALAVDPLCGSVLESLLRVLLVAQGLAPTCSQFEVRDGARVVGRVDFAWPAARLIVEADGFAYHADRESYRRDRERDNELERLGWKVLRFTWEDVVGRPDYVIAMVRAVLAQAA